MSGRPARKDRLSLATVVSGCNVMMYSRPSGVNPPSSLNKEKLARWQGDCRCNAAGYASVSIPASPARQYLVFPSAPPASQVHPTEPRAPRFATGYDLPGGSDPAGERDSTGLSSKGASIPDAIKAHNLIVQRLLRHRGIFVEDDEIRCQPLHPPVGVGLNEVAAQSPFFSGSAHPEVTMGRSPEMP